MELYAAIDLHSNNSVLAVIDEARAVVFERRLPNDLALIFDALAPFRDRLQGIAVESTYNWYWLVDGLQDAGVRVHLVNTTAVQQYSGLKHGDDHSDARWLAQLLQLGFGLLPIAAGDERVTLLLPVTRSRHHRCCPGKMLPRGRNA